MPTRRPTFPGTFERIPTRRLLEVFVAAPDRLRAVLVGLEPGELDRRPAPGKWTLRENLVHTVDSELVGAVRFRMVIASPGATLPGYDQDVWARSFRYGDPDAIRLIASLDLFESLRRTTAGLLESAEPSDWEQGGYHPESGFLTLRQLLELYADHAEWHLWRMLQIRELIGHPRSLELLLPDRLFPDAVADWP